MMTGQITPRAANKAHNLQECNKLPTGQQPQEAEGGECNTQICKNIRNEVISLYMLPLFISTCEQLP
jgi:hypothetical protein